MLYCYPELTSYFSGQLTGRNTPENWTNEQTGITLFSPDLSTLPSCVSYFNISCPGNDRARITALLQTQPPGTETQSDLSKATQLGSRAVLCPGRLPPAPPSHLQMFRSGRKATLPSPGEVSLPGQVLFSQLTVFSLLTHFCL